MAESVLRWLSAGDVGDVERAGHGAYFDFAVEDVEEEVADLLDGEH